MMNKLSQLLRLMRKIRCPKCGYEFEPEKTETAEEQLEEEIVAEDEATEELPEETDKVKEYVEIATEV